jgi:hypothetical protein
LQLALQLALELSFQLSLVAAARVVVVVVAVVVIVTHGVSPDVVKTHRLSFVTADLLRLRSTNDLRKRLTLVQHYIRFEVTGSEANARKVASQSSSNADQLTFRLGVSVSLRLRFLFCCFCRRPLFEHVPNNSV